MSWTLPPTTATQREVLWGDCLDLITQGFLTTSVRIQSHYFMVRSMVPDDLGYLRAMLPKSSPDWDVWLCARSILSLDGFRFPEYPDGKVIRSIKRLPETVVRELVRAVLDLTHKARSQNQVIPIFCLETRSRQLWSTTPSTRHPFGYAPLHSEAHMLWSLWNQLEDQHLQNVRKMTENRYLMSAWVGDGARKIEKQQQDALATEQQRREALLDRHYYEFCGVDLTGVEDRDELFGTLRRNQYGLYVPHTVEDLSEELRKLATGEKDVHDLIVEDVKQQIRDKAEQLRQSYMTGIVTPKVTDPKHPTKTGDQEVYESAVSYEALPSELFRNRQRVVYEEDLDKQLSILNSGSDTLFEYRDGRLLPKSDVGVVDARSVLDTLQNDEAPPPTSLSQKIRERGPKLR